MELFFIVFTMDNYQTFLSNIIFLTLLITMFFYWLSLFFGKKKSFYIFAKSGSRFSTALIFLILSWRWYYYNYFPLSNLYESLMFLSCILLLLYQKIEYEINSKVIGAIITPLVLVIQGFSSFTLPTSMQKASSLVPALQSNWLMLHVSMMLLSYATLLLGSLFSLLYLILDKRKVLGLSVFSKVLKKKENNVFSLSMNNTTLSLEQTSNFSKKDENLYKKRLSLLKRNYFGAVWANDAWGSYWSWDPKETWALITWLVFAAYLHIRITVGWEEKKAAILGSIGFVVVWICYLGVNFLGQGLHSYGFL
uniref:cytochrome c biogenesis protein n=1 Tax=Fibrocapsa japonica TaxID=94617 RepID=UPI00211521E6|nr:cytochrome c biogenesis protein [Fibrocapsa japonica]UTE95084.1 cytochrome c biogenesis protein [Fibrocapsa japonica]